MNWQNVGNVTAWTVNVGLQPAMAYWWQVRAVNSSGQVQADGGQWWYFITASSSGGGRRHAGGVRQAPAGEQRERPAVEPDAELGRRE